MTSMPLDGNTSSGQQAAAAPSGLLNKIPLPPVLQNMLDERKKQEWASWVDAEFEKCKTSRAVFERQWFLNLAFTDGRQYVNPIDVPNTGFRLTTPKAPPWRVRLVVNKIRTAVRVECSKLTSSRPIPVVVPATTEDEDFMAARVGEQLLKTEFATSKFDKEYKSFVWWGVVTGNSFLKSYWNPNEIDPAVQPPPTPIKGAMGEVLTDPVSGEPLMQKPEPVKGVICTERVTPFHIFVPDLLSEGLESQPYVIHAMTRSVRSVEKDFPELGKVTADSKSTNTILESAVLAPKGVENNYDSVLVKEIWLKPNAHPDFPEGGMLTIVNHKVAQVQEKWPWPFKEFPFYKYDGIPSGSFYTTSIVVDLIPLQKEYNRTKSQMIEIKNTMGKPKLMYMQGSLDPRKISSEPGQGIPYKAGFQPPTPIPGAEIPATMGIELDRLTSDFDDISGQHEITRGNTPAQVTSGTAIAFLQEQDDSKLAYQVASIEHCMETLGNHYLKYVAHYWSEERLIRISGLDNYYEAKRWKGADLRGNTDVRIQSGSALPFSKAAKQALITEFMTNGWIDPASGMEILDMGGFEKIMNDFLVDKRQAQRENMKLADIDPSIIKTLMEPPVGPDGQPMVGPDGQPVGLDGMPFAPQPPMPVNSWDNHPVHIQIHNQYRKTQQFELLPPEIKQAFELHVQTHQMAMQSQLIGAGGNVVENAAPPEEELPPEAEDGSAGEQFGGAA